MDQGLAMLTACTFLLLEVLHYTELGGGAPVEIMRQTDDTALGAVSNSVDDLNYQHHSYPK